MQYNTLIPRDESEWVREATYHPDRRVLEIRIEGTPEEERVYFYEDVPEYVYIDLLNADSKGSFYNNHIKGEFDTFSSDVSN